MNRKRQYKIRTRITSYIIFFIFSIQYLYPLPVYSIEIEGVSNSGLPVSTGSTSVLDPMMKGTAYNDITLSLATDYVTLGENDFQYISENYEYKGWKETTDSGESVFFTIKDVISNEIIYSSQTILTKDTTGNVTHYSHIVKADAAYLPELYLGPLHITGLLTDDEFNTLSGAMLLEEVGDETIGGKITRDIEIDIASYNNSGSGNIDFSQITSSVLLSNVSDNWIGYAEALNNIQEQLLGAINSADITEENRVDLSIAEGTSVSLNNTQTISIENGKLTEKNATLKTEGVNGETVTTNKETYDTEGHIAQVIQEVDGDTITVQFEWTGDELNMINLTTNNGDSTVYNIVEENEFYSQLIRTETINGQEFFGEFIVTEDGSTILVSQSDKLDRLFSNSPWLHKSLTPESLISLKEALQAGSALSDIELEYEYEIRDISNSEANWKFKQRGKYIKTGNEQRFQSDNLDVYYGSYQSSDYVATISSDVIEKASSLREELLKQFDSGDIADSWDATLLGYFGNKYGDQLGIEGPYTDQNISELKGKLQAVFEGDSNLEWKDDTGVDRFIAAAIVYAENIYADNHLERYPEEWAFKFGDILIGDLSGSLSAENDGSIPPLPAMAAQLNPVLQEMEISSSAPYIDPVTGDVLYMPTESKQVNPRNVIDNFLSKPEFKEAYGTRYEDFIKDYNSFVYSPFGTHLAPAYQVMPLGSDTHSAWGWFHQILSVIAIIFSGGLAGNPGAYVPELQQEGYDTLYTALLTQSQSIKANWTSDEIFDAIYLVYQNMYGNVYKVALDSGFDRTEAYNKALNAATAVFNSLESTYADKIAKYNVAPTVSTTTWLDVASEDICILSIPLTLATGVSFKPLLLTGEGLENASGLKIWGTRILEILKPQNWDKIMGGMVSFGAMYTAFGGIQSAIRGDDLNTAVRSAKMNFALGYILGSVASVFAIPDASMARWPVLNKLATNPGGIGSLIIGKRAQAYIMYGTKLSRVIFGVDKIASTIGVSYGLNAAIQGGLDLAGVEDNPLLDTGIMLLSFLMAMQLFYPASTGMESYFPMQGNSMVVNGKEIGYFDGEGNFQWLIKSPPKSMAEWAKYLLGKR